MTGRAALLIALLLQASSTPTIAAQADMGFAGEWRSVAAKPAIASLRITQGATGWTAQAFGACQPTPCDWGTVPFTILERRPNGSGGAVGFATWRRGSATRVMTFRLGEGSLVVEIYNLFSGPKDQPSYFITEELALPLRPAARSTPPKAK
jgi:hypothetical protein